MVTRGIWFAAGAATGVYAMVKARRVAEAFTADGMKDRINAVSVGARLFREEMAQGTAEAEADLRDKYRAAAAAHGHRELETAAQAHQHAPEQVGARSLTDRRERDTD